MRKLYPDNIGTHWLGRRILPLLSRNEVVVTNGAGERPNGKPKLHDSYAP